RRLADRLKDLFQAAHLVLGLGQMGAQAGGELPVSRLLNHLGQRFHDLIFCVIHVLQGMEEKILHRFYVFAEQTHSGAPVFGFAFSLIERVERKSQSERFISRSLADCARSNDAETCRRRKFRVMECAEPNRAAESLLAARDPSPLPLAEPVSAPR